MKKLLLAALCCAACVTTAYAEDIVHQLSPETGSFSGGGQWHSVFTTSGSAAVTVTASANNMGLYDGAFDFRSGQSKSSTYTITENYYYYYVSGFSFNARMAGTNTVERKVQIEGQNEVVLTDENQLFTISGLQYGTEAHFYITGENETILITDFTVTLSPIPDSEFAGDVAAESEAIELWRPVLGEELYAEKKALIDAEVKGTKSNVDKTLAIQAINSNWMAEANGRLIYIKNVRRSEIYGKYLSGYANNTANTEAAPVAISNWYIERVNNTMTFKLFNPETNRYIAKDGSLVASGNSNIAVFELRKNTDASYPGTAFFITNRSGSDGLNMNNVGGNLTNYGYNDGGSSWIISLAGVPASEIQNGKYYRIRSARSLAKTDYRSEGSLLGINTPVEDNQAKGDIPNDGSKFSGLGTIWKVEDAGNGKHYLRNVATDKSEGMSYFGTGAAYCNMPSSSALGKFEFLSSDSNWSRKHPNAIIIKNQNNQYFDKKNTGADAMGTWTQCDNNWPDNGGIYYFEEATDLDEIQDAYISALNDNIWSTEVKNSKVNEIQYYANVPNIWTPDVVSSALAALEGLGETVSSVSTVAEANAFVWNTTNLGDLKAAKIESDAIWEQFFASADGKTFVAENLGRNNGSGDFMGFVESQGDNENILGILHDKADLAAHWTLQIIPGTYKFLIRNYLNNRFAGYNTQLDHPFSTSENESGAERYEIVPCVARGENAVGFKSSTASDMFMHENGARNMIVRWYAPTAADNAASAWRMAAIDTEELVPSVENSHVILSSENGSIDKHASYGDHHVITLSMAQLTRSLNEPLSISPAEAEITSDGTAKINFGAELEPGDYTLNVPASVFKVNGKVSAPINYTFSVTDNGSTTGVTEVGNASSDVKVVYDLQGRRVMGNAKGLLIINGKKTLVK